LSAFVPRRALRRFAELRQDECFCGRKNYRLQDIQLSKSACFSDSRLCQQVPAVNLVVGQNFLFYDPRSPDASRTGNLSLLPAFAKATAGNLHVHSSVEVGEYRARTGDLLVANQALSQLS
jgi:hypothetical protein